MDAPPLPQLLHQPQHHLQPLQVQNPVAKETVVARLKTAGVIIFVRSIMTAVQTRQSTAQLQLLHPLQFQHQLQHQHLQALHPAR